MAGHSKWANIQHRKKAQDAKRGKLFTRLIREIMVAVKSGGAEPAHNPRLRAAIDNALSHNMTRDKIEHAIKRATGATETETLQEIRYEGYAAGGVAVLVDCVTDNRNRTVAEVRHAFSKCGGSLGASGSVAFQFKHLGQIILSNSIAEEQLFEVALEIGAEDIQVEEDSYVVLTLPDTFSSVKEALLHAGFELAQAEITMVPNNYVALTPEDAQKVVRLIDMLEELDDVQNVYTNADPNALALAME